MPATPPDASAAAALVGLAGGDFLSSADLTPPQTRALLQLAADLKAGRRCVDLGGKVLGLIFSKASTRTRVSFTVAMARLGGQTIDLLPIVTQVGRGEPVADTARVLSRYCDALAIRTFAQADLEAYAHWATIPVINALTDLEHPCQALADFLTLQEAFSSSPSDLAGLTLAYVGDGNNVAHSLMLCGALLGVNVRIGCPGGLRPRVGGSGAGAGPGGARRPGHGGARSAGGGAGSPGPLHRCVGLHGPGGGASPARAGLRRLVPG